MSAVLLGYSNFMTYDVCQILTQSILIEMFRTFGCLEKLDGCRSANGYKDHASQEKPQFSTQDWKHTQSDTTIQQWHTKAHTNTTSQLSILPCQNHFGVKFIYSCFAWQTYKWYVQIFLFSYSNFVLLSILQSLADGDHLLQVVSGWEKATENTAAHVVGL